MAPRQLALPTRRQATSAWIEIDRPLTVHSTGLGVESNAFTVLVNEDPRFEQYQPYAYVHVDTGGELPHTHQIMLTSINEYLGQHGQEILVIAPDDERYQTPSKAYPMDEAYLRQPKPGTPFGRNSVTALLHDQSQNRAGSQIPQCAGRHALGEMEAVRPTYGAGDYRCRRALRPRKGEADRCGGRTSYVDPNAKYVEVRYPLVEHDVTRADCYDVLHDHNLPALKSGCFWCPFQPIAWRPEGVGDSGARPARAPVV